MAWIGTYGRRPRWALPVLVLLAVALAPGVAAAAPPGGLTPGHGTVTPLLDCVRPDGAGGFTAVLGYRNSGTATLHLSGAGNLLLPGDGAQPTKFSSGTHHGVFSVRVAGGSVVWTLAGTTLVADGRSTACPAGSDLPADGNGLGPTIVLVAAGVAGAAAVVVARRRRPA